MFATLLYLVVAGLAVVTDQTPYDPNRLLGFMLGIVILIGQMKNILVDWTPLGLVILAYEYMRSMIPALNPAVHYQLMIRFDNFLFGQLPTSYLQNLLFSAERLEWYDYASTILYSMHLIVPLLVAAALWKTDRKIFERYILAMIALSYIAFLTYLLFPAAPPWLASQLGFIFPPVRRITETVFENLFGFISLPVLYKYLGVNLVAAVPSLHAAYPLLASLFVSKKYPKLSLVMMAYSLAVWFAVIYLGEHYFFDVLLGVVYALSAYELIQNWSKQKARIMFWRTASKNTPVAES